MFGVGEFFGPILGKDWGPKAGNTSKIALNDADGRPTLTNYGQIPVYVHGENLKDGPMGEALNSPQKRKELTDQLAAIRDNLSSLHYDKDRDGNLKGSFDPKISQLALNKKLDDPLFKAMGLEATNLYFKDGKLNFDVTKTANGKDIKFTEGDLQVGLKAGIGKEFQRLSISKVVMTKDERGKPHAELEFYGRDGRTKLF